MVIFAIAIGFVFTGCDNAAKKVENAEENVTEAKDELKDAKAEYAADMENYKRQSAEKYESNMRSIE